MHEQGLAQLQGQRHLCSKPLLLHAWWTEVAVEVEAAFTCRGLNVLTARRHQGTARWQQLQKAQQQDMLQRNPKRLTAHSKKAQNKSPQAGDHPRPHRPGQAAAKNHTHNGQTRTQARRLTYGDAALVCRQLPQVCERGGITVLGIVWVHASCEK